MQRGDGTGNGTGADGGNLGNGTDGTNPGEHSGGAGDDGAKRSSVEDTAAALGWSAEYDGPDKIDAAEFMRRKPLFDKIKAQNRDLKELKKSVNGMADTFKKMSDAQYAKGIKDAASRMEAAEKTYDVAGYKQAAMEKAQLEVAQQQTAVTTDGEPPEVSDFISRNPWFDKDKTMTADALDYRERFMRANPRAELSEILAYVEQRMKRDYPDQFKTPGDSSRKAAGSSVESGGATPSGGNPLAKLKAKMSGDELRIMKHFVTGKPGAMTENEYLTEYAQVRGEG
jgi:hypothetical protein